MSLNDGVLVDQSGRTGYIASNYQFQFDKPPQAGAIYTAGFSVCSNGSLALGGSAVWYECQSGAFYNLYDQSWAPQCMPIFIEVIGASTGTTTASPVATEASEGQPEGTTVVTEASEGQPEGTTIVTSVSQRTDGQPIATTAKVSPTPVSEQSEGQPIAPSSIPPVSEASEGQPRATTTPAVSEASEGQPRVTSTAPPVSEASEGQPQVTTSSAGAPVSIASEGQPRVTSAASNSTVSTPSRASSASAAATFSGLAVPLRAGDAMVALAGAAAFALF